MSRAEFRIGFDGEALADHSMDVRDLAPALLGLGEVFVEANRILNGKDVHIDLRVTPKIEENCFDIGLEVFQQWETVKRLLGDSNITAAKEMIDWIVLNKEVGGGAVFAGLVWLYKKIKGKRPVNVIRFNDEHGNALYRYQFDGEEDVIVDEKVHQLYSSDKIRSQMGRFLRPAAVRSGIREIFAYRIRRKGAETVTLSKSEVREIDFSPPEQVPEETPEVGETLIATLRVYSPVYDLQAPRWRFWYGKNHHYMNVADSNIRQVVLDNGGALVDDRFRVRLEVIERETESAKKEIEYKVLEVLEFIPAFRQPDLFQGDDEENKEDQGTEPEGGPEEGAS